MKRIAFVFALMVLLVVGGSELADATRDRGREETPTLRLIEKIGRERGAPRKLITAVKSIACKESSCGRNPVATREKSRVWARLAKKIAKNKHEEEALRHSYGATQLSGVYTKLEYGIDPAELFDDEVNIPIAFDKAERLFRKCHGSEY